MIMWTGSMPPPITSFMKTSSRTSRTFFVVPSANLPLFFHSSPKVELVGKEECTAVLKSGLKHDTLVSAKFAA